MELVCILLITFSAFLHSIWNFLTKESRDKHIFIWLFLFSALIFFLPVFIYLYHRNEIQFIGWFYVLLTGFFCFGYFVLLGKSYSCGHLSLVYPLARSAPLFVPIWAFLFIDEKISLTGIIGILIILFGVHVLHLKHFSIKGFRYIKGKASLFAILTALFVSFYSLTSKISVSYINPFIFVYLILFVSWFLLTPYILIRKKGLIKKEWDLNKKNIISAGILNVLSYFLIVFVMQTSKVSYIISIRQISVVFGVLLGNLVLKEKYGKIRLIASLIIFAGVFLVGIAE